MEPERVVEARSLQRGDAERVRVHRRHHHREVRRVGEHALMEQRIVGHRVARAHPASHGRWLDLFAEHRGAAHSADLHRELARCAVGAALAPDRARDTVVIAAQIAHCALECVLIGLAHRPADRVHRDLVRGPGLVTVVRDGHLQDRLIVLGRRHGSRSERAAGSQALDREPDGLCRRAAAQKVRVKRVGEAVPE
jgi:hypothetical protein